MVTWFKKHSRGLNFFGGIFILLITMLLYFWTTTQSEVVASTGKSAQEKRMDRSVRGHSNIITRKSQKSKDMSVFSKKLKNNFSALPRWLTLCFSASVNWAKVFFNDS